MQKTNLIKLERLLKSRHAINVNHKLIKDILGFDDMRDFTEALYYWGYQTDFTYQDSKTENWQSHLRAFLRSYLD